MGGLRVSCTGVGGEHDPIGWLGDGKIFAHAIDVDPDRFRLDIQTVVLTKVAAGGRELEISSWRVDG